MSERCWTCDSRYCGHTCHADDPTYAYVVGVGWKRQGEAGRYYLDNYSVDWRASRVATRKPLYPGVRSKISA